MTLMIEHEYDRNDFIRFLKRRMLGYISMHINLDKVRAFDEYFESDGFKKTYGDVNVCSATIFKLSILNLKVVHYPTYATITVDDTIMYPNTHIRLIDLCKLMNYGNLSVEAYPIISDTFRHFSTHIKDYVNKYRLGVG